MTTSIPETIWERFRNHTATESDLRAIWDENEQQLAANPRLARCPDFEAFMGPLLWQIERMDCTRDASGNWIEGEPTMADALAVLAEVEQEEL